jgi:hypothetical protein
MYGEDMRDLSKIGCLVFLLAGLIMAPVAGFAIYGDRRACYTAWQDFGPEWSLWGGCRVTFNGKRVPTATLRKVDLED